MLTIRYHLKQVPDIEVNVLREVVSWDVRNTCFGFPRLAVLRHISQNSIGKENMTSPIASSTYSHYSGRSGEASPQHVSAVDYGDIAVVDMVRNIR